MMFDNKKLLVALFLVSFVFLNLNLSSEIVEGRGRSSELEVIYRKAEPDPMMTGEYADVWVKVRNTGNSAAEDVSLEFVPEYPFSVDPDADTERFFGDIDPGDEYHARFKIRVDENAVPGENELKFRTDTRNARIIRKLDVQVRSRESVLTVEDVEIEDDKIPPSKTKDVTFTFRNRADIYMRNIDVSLGLRPATADTMQMDSEAQMLGTADFDDIEEIPMITVGSTTQKRIGRIGPGEEKEVTFPIKAESDADEEAYKVPLGFNYEDEMGNKWQKIEYTGLTVGGEPQLEMGFANIDEMPVPGTTRDVSLRIVNRGLSEGKFLEIELLPHESYEVVGEPDTYIGHMQPDDFDSPSFDIYINPDSELVEIPVELDYRDSEGNVITEQQTVTFRTYSREEIDRLGLDEESSMLIYVIVLILIIGLFYYYRRRKKEKRRDLLEDE